jgi:hypothetical protein
MVSAVSMVKMFTEVVMETALAEVAEPVEVHLGKVVVDKMEKTLLAQAAVAEYQQVVTTHLVLVEVEQARVVVETALYLMALN